MSMEKDLATLAMLSLICSITLGFSSAASVRELVAEEAGSPANLSRGE
jgi:hypothetical protein